MNKNKILIITLSLIIVGGAGYLFFKKNKKNEEPLFVVRKPKIKSLTQYVNASGTLKAKDEIKVGSLVAGKVIKIHVDDNDFVKENQILAELDDGIGDSAVKKIKAIIKEVEAEITYQQSFYDRQKVLYQANQISKDTFEKYTKDLDVLKAKLEQNKAELEIRQKEYDETFIKSPVDGVIIAKEVDLGQMITSRLAATVLFVIAKDLHEMEAHVDVDEADVGMVQDKQEAVFKVDSFPKKKFKSKVKQIRYLAKIVDNVVTYATILEVSNPKLQLRPGMTTDVDIKVAEANNSLAVHNRCLRIDSLQLESIAKQLDYDFERIPNTTHKTEIDSIWTLENNKKFKQIKVKIGVRQGKYTQIISDHINKNTQIVYEVSPAERENLLLKQIFAKPGTIGSKKN